MGGGGGLLACLCIVSKHTQERETYMLEYWWLNHGDESMPVGNFLLHLSGTVVTKTKKRQPWGQNFCNMNGA